MDGYIDPNRYENRSDYLNAVRERDISSGVPQEKADFDAGMREANGEEWEGQFGGAPGY